MLPGTAYNHGKRRRQGLIHLSLSSELRPDVASQDDLSAVLLHTA